MSGHLKNALKIIGSFFFVLAAPFPSYAAQPEPWQMTLQPAVTDLMRDIVWFEYFTLIIITAIAVFVTLLLLWVMIRYRKAKQPVASRTSHNTLLEVAWTVVPIFILVIIAVPSFRLLAKDMTIPEPDLTIKTTGYQWYWGYEYPDYGGLSFEAIMLSDEEIASKKKADNLTDKDLPRLLATDYDVVVPVNKVVKLQITAADVMHAFAVPAFGVKMDAIPGRLNETWFKAEKEGIYYGQCSELCGKDHAFMPIAVRVVSQEAFDQWINLAQKDIDAANEQLAQSLKKQKTSLAELAR